APRSARTMPANGTGPMPPSSRTASPASGPLMRDTVPSVVLASSAIAGGGGRHPPPSAPPASPPVSGGAVPQRRIPPIPRHRRSAPVPSEHLRERLAKPRLSFLEQRYGFHGTPPKIPATTSFGASPITQTVKPAVW